MAELIHADAPSLIRTLNIHRPLAPDAYYRSKIPSASISSNPYIAASAPILSILERLLQSQTLPPVEQLRTSLFHELNAFYSHLDAKDLHAEGISLAYFLMTVTMDELVGKSYLRVYGEAHPFYAFTPQSFSDDKPEKRFFILIDKLKANPNQSLDLLELAYYCLLLGVEGEYHATAGGRQHLDDLSEEIYQIIKSHRCEHVKSWYQAQTPHSKTRVLLSKKLILSLVLAGICIGAGWFLSRYYIEHRLDDMLLSYQERNLVVRA